GLGIKTFTEGTLEIGEFSNLNWRLGVAHGVSFGVRARVGGYCYNIFYGIQLLGNKQIHKNCSGNCNDPHGAQTVALLPAFCLVAPFLTSISSLSSHNCSFKQELFAADFPMPKSFCLGKG